jgi:3-isopropylmalate dehydrogenase
MIASACMMLDHLEENELAAGIRNAIAAVISDGKVRTYDMMKMKGSSDVIQKGAASTRQMADAVIQKLKS